MLLMDDLVESELDDISQRQVTLKEAVRPKVLYRAVVDRYGVLVEMHALIADMIVEKQKRSVTVDATSASCKNN